MKFTPSTMAGDIGDKNFINLIKVYFERKGFHNQINVVSKEVLEDVVAHPENYSGLLVRVAGYSLSLIHISLVFSIGTDSVPPSLVPALWGSWSPRQKNLRCTRSCSSPRRR